MRADSGRPLLAPCLRSRSVFCARFVSCFRVLLFAPRGRRKPQSKKRTGHKKSKQGAKRGRPESARTLLDSSRRHPLRVPPKTAA